MKSFNSGQKQSAAVLAPTESVLLYPITTEKAIAMIELENKLVFVVEMNDEGLYGYGQLAGLLRARFCDPKIRGLNKTDGLTWRVREILERAKSAVAEGLRKM